MGEIRGKWLSAFASAALSAVISVFNASYYLIPPRWVAKRDFPLLEAIKQGDTEAVRALLAQGADPNTRETQIGYRTGLYSRVTEVPEAAAKTALIFAVSEGHQAIVDFLLESGADVNAQAGYGDTALAWASVRTRT